MEKSAIGKILVIRNDKIGDIITSSGMFRELKKNFPSSKITLVCSDSNKALVEKNPYIDTIWTLGYSPRKIKDFSKYFKLYSRVKKERFDLGIDLRGGLSNILFLLYLPRVKFKTGFYNQKIGRYFLDDAWGKDKIRNNSAVLRRDMLNKSLGLNIKNFWPDIHVDKKDKSDCAKIMKKHNLKSRKFICINPDASAEKKQWPLENFDFLIKTLGKKFPTEKILLVGADEKKINYLKERNPDSIPLIKESLRALYLLFRKAGLVIAHDGGPMHLAWAGKSKLIALFPKELPLEYVKPLGKNSHYFHTDLKKLKPQTVEKLIEEII